MPDRLAGVASWKVWVSYEAASVSQDGGGEGKPGKRHRGLSGVKRPAQPRPMLGMDRPGPTRSGAGDRT